MEQNSSPGETLVPRVWDEETVNSATHAIGLVLSIVGAALLVSTAARQGDTSRLLACCVYSAALVAVYAASTLSHVFHDTHLRRFFRAADQALIYLLIAGTYTPIAVAWLHTGWLWLLFGAIWSVALAGFFSKAIFAHRVEAVSTVLHLVLGWMPLLGLRWILVLVPHPLLMWMLAGGILYTLGIFFLIRDGRVPFFHAVWHLLVIAASACHFWGIFTYCAALPQ